MDSDALNYIIFQKSFHYMTTTLTQPQRLASVDILRALTMLLMIFVNDLWTLKGIPDWLEHVSAKADGDN